MSPEREPHPGGSYSEEHPEEKDPNHPGGAYRSEVGRPSQSDLEEVNSAISLFRATEQWDNLADALAAREELVPGFIDQHELDLANRRTNTDTDEWEDAALEKELESVQLARDRYRDNKNPENASTSIQEPLATEPVANPVEPPSPAETIAKKSPVETRRETRPARSRTDRAPRQSTFGYERWDDPAKFAAESENLQRILASGQGMSENMRRMATDRLSALHDQMKKRGVPIPEAPARTVKPERRARQPRSDRQATDDKPAEHRTDPRRPLPSERRDLTEALASGDPNRMAEAFVARETIEPGFLDREAARLAEQASRAKAAGKKMSAAETKAFLAEAAALRQARQRAPARPAPSGGPADPSKLPAATRAPELSDREAYLEAMDERGRQDAERRTTADPARKEIEAAAKDAVRAGLETPSAATGPVGVNSELAETVARSMTEPSAPEVSAADRASRKVDWRKVASVAKNVAIQSLGSITGTRFFFLQHEYAKGTSRAKAFRQLITDDMTNVGVLLSREEADRRWQARPQGEAKFAIKEGEAPVKIESVRRPDDEKRTTGSEAVVRAAELHQKIRQAGLPPERERALLKQVSNALRGRFDAEVRINSGSAAEIRQAIDQFAGSSVRRLELVKEGLNTVMMATALASGLGLTGIAAREILGKRAFLYGGFAAMERLRKGWGKAGVEGKTGWDKLGATAHDLFITAARETVKHATVGQSGVSKTQQWLSRVQAIGTLMRGAGIAGMGFAHLPESWQQALEQTGHQAVPPGYEAAEAAIQRHMEAIGLQSDSLPNHGPASADTVPGPISQASPADIGQRWFGSPAYGATVEHAPTDALPADTSGLETPETPEAGDTPAATESRTLNLAEPPGTVEVPRSFDTYDGQMDDALIHKGEGIEHALRRQLEHDPAAHGYEGNPDDLAAIRQWSGHEAHRLAINEGFIQADGTETRVLDTDADTRYILKPDGQVEAVNATTYQHLPTPETTASTEPFEAALRGLERLERPPVADLGIVDNLSFGPGEAKILTDRLESFDDQHVRQIVKMMKLSDLHDLPYDAVAEKYGLDSDDFGLAIQQMEFAVKDAAGPIYDKLNPNLTVAEFMEKVGQGSVPRSDLVVESAKQAAEETASSNEPAFQEIAKAVGNVEAPEPEIWEPLTRLPKDQFTDNEVLALNDLVTKWEALKDRDTMAELVHLRDTVTTSDNWRQAIPDEAGRELLQRYAAARIEQIKT